MKQAGWLKDARLRLMSCLHKKCLAGPPTWIGGPCHHPRHQHGAAWRRSGKPPVLPRQQHCLVQRHCRRSSRGPGPPEAASDLQEQTTQRTNSPESWTKWEQTPDAARAYALLFTVLALGLIPGVDQYASAGLDIVYFILLATISVFIAAHRSLTAPRQQITLSQGALAPIAASVVLFGSFLLIQWLPKITLQTVFNSYFFLLGTFAVSGGVKAPLRAASGRLARPLLTFKLPEGWAVDQQGNSVRTTSVSSLDLLTLSLGLLVAYGDLFYGHRNFTLNNAVACLIVADILQLIGFNSFKTAALTLAGLLVYDGFWVFGSASTVGRGENVMLKMATSDVLAGPVRLLFPHAVAPGTHPAFPFSLLGLGDIAVPGLLIALAVRFDATLLQGGPVAAAEPHGVVPPASAKPYFWTALGSYLLGLGLAFSARLWSNEGQPALVYIVPSMLLALLAQAAYRGQLRELVDYQEAPMVSALSPPPKQTKTP